ncbi:MAG: hypothetical protein ABH886_04945 [Candidatus Desantisbacteria bacterium]
MKRYQGLKKMGLMGSVVLVLGVLLGLVANYAVADTGNLILNSGAENGMANWDSGGTNFRASNEYGARSGSYHFYGGDNNGYSQAAQFVDISSYAKAIDDGQVWASLGGYVKGYGGDRDEARLALWFMSGDNTLLADYGKGYQDLYESWEYWDSSLWDKLLLSGCRTGSRLKPSPQAAPVLLKPCSVISHSLPQASITVCRYLPEGIFSLPKGQGMTFVSRKAHRDMTQILN